MTLPQGVSDHTPRWGIVEPLGPSMIPADWNFERHDVTVRVLQEVDATSHSIFTGRFQWSIEARIAPCAALRFIRVMFP